MATVTTITTSGAFGFPPNSSLDRNRATGHLWMVVRPAAGSLNFYKSTDEGVSWAAAGTLARTGLFDIGEMRIDRAGDHMHIVYLVNESGSDKLIYKRVDIRSGTGTPANGELVVSTVTAAVARDYWHSAAIVPYKNPDNTFAIVIAGAFHGVSSSGVVFYGVSIRNDVPLTTYANNGILVSTRTYKLTGDDTSITVSMDLEHNGDGITSAAPHLWAAFQIKTTVWATRFSWKGYKSGWTTPTSAPGVAWNRLSTVRDIPGRWDGKRFLMLSVNPGDQTKVEIHERNASNTGTAAKRTSPTHPQGAITVTMLSYNHANQDCRVFAVGTTTAVCYWVDYTRATNTWGTWQTVSATAPVASEWGVRRSTYGTYAYDFYMQSGASSPWTVSNTILTVNFGPTAPTWITGTAGTVTRNGAAFDASSSLLLDWQFNDPNENDTQSAWSLSRQIGAAAVQYWRTSDSTWQVSEVQNVGATTSVTLTTGQWLGGGGAGDAAHVYKVKTWDASSVASVYSTGLSVIPSTRIDPTLTAPVGGAILNTGLVTATWTVTEQSAYQVKVTNTATTKVVHDSGWLTDPTPGTPSVLSYIVPTILPDGFPGSLTLQTRNAEGLASVVRTAAFTVDFVEPVAPLVSAVTAAPLSGGNLVTLTQPAATGTQPATTVLDLWRREIVSTTATNTNPYFETNATDWSNVSYTSAVRSTAQFHQGAASLLCTPTGAAASPYVHTTTIYPAAVGSRWDLAGWFRSTTANKTVRVKLMWYDAGNVLLSESTRDMTPVAGVWVWATHAATAPASTAGVRVAVGQLNTPAVGDTLYVDELVLMPANDDVGIRIAAAIPSGTQVLDWRAVSGVAYQYRGYARAANATDVYGPWIA